MRPRSLCLISSDLLSVPLMTSYSCTAHPRLPLKYATTTNRGLRPSMKNNKSLETAQLGLYGQAKEGKVHSRRMAAPSGAQA